MLDGEQKQTDLRSSLQYDVMKVIADQYATKEPIRKGCGIEGGCFCTGRCQEIIGWRDKEPTNHFERLKKNGNQN
jgi:hypothetical protein